MGRHPEKGVTAGLIPVRPALGTQGASRSRSGRFLLNDPKINLSDFPPPRTLDGALKKVQ
jgi:hypothetical protein